MLFLLWGLVLVCCSVVRVPGVGWGWGQLSLVSHVCTPPWGCFSIPGWQMKSLTSCSYGITAPWQFGRAFLSATARGNGGPALWGGAGEPEGHLSWRWELSASPCTPSSLWGAVFMTVENQGGGNRCLLLQLRLQWSVSCLQETLTQINEFNTIRNLFSHIKERVH